MVSWVIYVSQEETDDQGEKGSKFCFSWISKLVSDDYEHLIDIKCTILSLKVEKLLVKIQR